MTMTMTRASLTPCNEPSVSLNTNTDLKHAYLPQATKMNFRKPGSRAHWWSRSKAPVHLRQPACVTPPNTFLPTLLPPHTMSKVRTHLMIWELIRKRWQWGLRVWISTRQFPHSPRAQLGTRDAFECRAGAVGGYSLQARNRSTLLDLIYNWPTGPNIVMLSCIHFT